VTNEEIDLTCEYFRMDLDEISDKDNCMPLEAFMAQVNRRATDDYESQVRLLHRDAALWAVAYSSWNYGTTAVPVLSRRTKRTWREFLHDVFTDLLMLGA
jgi:hypothetical protein